MIHGVATTLGMEYVNRLMMPVRLQDRDLAVLLRLLLVVGQPKALPCLGPEHGVI